MYLWVLHPLCLVTKSWELQVPPLPTRLLSQKGSTSLPGGCHLQRQRLTEDLLGLLLEVSWESLDIIQCFCSQDPLHEMPAEIHLVSGVLLASPPLVRRFLPFLCLCLRRNPI